MDKDIITTDTIINWLQNQVEQKLPIDAHTWLDACQKITVLLGDEHDKLFELQQDISMQKYGLLLKSESEGKKMSVAEIKLRMEGTNIFTEMQKQQAKIKRIEEMVRIAKIQARMKDFEMRS